MPEFIPHIPRLRDEARELLDTYHLPGVGIGVVRGEELVHAEGFGCADIVAGQAYTPEARHRIGSITKTMIGFCAMALVDEGRLTLGASVPALLPDITFHGHADSLTLWHLLTHTGGIGEAPNVSDLTKPFDKLFYETDPSTPLPELYTEGITIEVPPGSKWAYANHGFALLGEIVSRAEREPLALVVARRVFEPLGMASSDLLDEPHPDLAHGYSQAATPEARSMLDLMGVQLESDESVDGHNLPGKFVRVWGNGGAGAVQSTVADMATYAAALLRGSRGIVRPETFAAMTSGQYRPDPRLPGWGLSFGVQDIGRHRSFGHGGAVFGGWNSYLVVFPDLDSALVFHTNLMTDEFDSIFAPRIVRAFLGLEDAPLDGISVDPSVLRTAPGVYEIPDAAPLTNFRPRFNPGRLQVKAEDGGLRLYSRRGPWKDGARLLAADHADPEVFAVEAAGYPRSKVILARNGRGEAEAIRLPRLVEMVQNPELEPWT
jgi:CubicO group peptidase (beta-lactamase class C family)